MDQEKGTILKSIAGELETLEQCANSFPELFTKEENAVVQHDIVSLEEVGLEKSKLVQKLGQSIQKVSAHCVKLSPRKASPKSFSDMIEVLNDFILKQTQSNLKSPSLVRLAHNLIEVLNSLISTYACIKPQIEKNRFIIARLLRHHQESYRFWSELKKENSSNYTAKGARESQSTISQVFAKA